MLTALIYFHFLNILANQFSNNKYILQATLIKTPQLISRMCFNTTPSGVEAEWPTHWGYSA